MSSNTAKLEMMNQFINVVLTRVNYSNELSNNQKPYLALKSLKKVIRPFFAATKDQLYKDKFKSWIETIDQIDSIQGIGATTMSIENDSWKKKNTAALKLYDQLEDQIWATLGDMEFFINDKPYGKAITDEDFKDAEEQ